jgi:hypothetical protein
VVGTYYQIKVLKSERMNLDKSSLGKVQIFSECILREIWGFHSSECLNYGFLGYGIVWS